MSESTDSSTRLRTSAVRVAVYQGGTEDDPSNATLVVDFGAVPITDATAWVGIKWGDGSVMFYSNAHPGKDWKVAL